MFNRNASLLVAGAAIFTLGASVASAQTTRPRSTRRIPITKDQPAAEPTPPRVDTVTVYHTDTLRTTRVDTVTQTNTVTHTDTVIKPVEMIPRHVGGVYLGLGAGPNLPFGAIRTVNEPGVVGQVQLGWQGLNNPLGIRIDGNFTQFSHSADYAVLGPRPQVWGGNADLRLNLPFFNHTLGSSVIFTPYLLGGGSALHYKNLRMKLDTDGGVTGGFGGQHAVIAGNETNNTTAAGVMDEDWHTDWGYNFGGGFAFHAGKKEMFVEARGIHFTHSDRFSSSWSVPIVFGVNFF